MFYQEEVNTQQALDSIMDQVAKRMASFDRKDKGAPRPGKTEIFGQSAGVSTVGVSASVVSMSAMEVSMSESSATKIQLGIRGQSAELSSVSSGHVLRPLIKEGKENNCLQENLVIPDHPQVAQDACLEKNMFKSELKGKLLTAANCSPTSRNESEITSANSSNMLVQSDTSSSQLTASKPLDNKMITQPAKNMKLGQPWSKANVDKCVSHPMKNQPANPLITSQHASQALSNNPLDCDKKPIGHNNISNNPTYNHGNLKMSVKGNSNLSGGPSLGTSAISNLIASQNISSSGGNISLERREGDEDYLLKNVANMDSLVSDLNNFLGKILETDVNVRSCNLYRNCS